VPDFKVESLLAARLFLQPQVAAGRVYFVSDLSGRLSLYAMDRAGSVPEPLLPPDVALMTPTLLEALPFYAFPKLDKMIVMIDQNGDENYQPMVVPLAGGIPEPLFPQFAGMQCTLDHADAERNLIILGVDHRVEPVVETYLADLNSGELTLLGSSPYGFHLDGANEDLTRVVLGESYEEGDVALFLWERPSEKPEHPERSSAAVGAGEPREHPERSSAEVRAAESKEAGSLAHQAAPFDSGLKPSAQDAQGDGLAEPSAQDAQADPAGTPPGSAQDALKAIFGVPMAQRAAGQEVPLNGIHSAHPVGHDGILMHCTLFDDRRGLACFTVGRPEDVQPVEITGGVHSGDGELDSVSHLAGNRYLVQYNIDGASWAYEATYDAAARRMILGPVICGEGALANGMAESIRYDQASGTYAISFSTASSPSQLVLVPGDAPKQVTFLTRNRVLGIPEHLLAGGEDAGFTSHDGLHIPARLYLPAPALGYEGKRPMVVYIHGGPQSQERPDFTWFSMPLIQFLTLNGMAVFVPNVRGSTGYGLDYTKRVDRDWGGADRLDHVAGLASLANHPRVDTRRAGVMGRSYGGYMTLMQVGMHPDLWSAAVDMFGPYNLVTFLERIPATWRPYFEIVLGHPERDREWLLERSPSTHLHRLACPMLVIQGRNDPRVVAAESEDLVRTLQAQGKDVSLLLFENEGHDVTKLENKVRCYTEIARFFSERLGV